MTGYGGLVVLMLSSMNGPIEFKETKLSCKEVSYTFMVEGKKYVGISADGKEYLTNYTDIDKLDTEVNKQCGKK